MKGGRSDGRVCLCTRQNGGMASKQGGGEKEGEREWEDRRVKGMKARERNMTGVVVSDLRTNLSSASNRGAVRFI